MNRLFSNIKESMENYIYWYYTSTSLIFFYIFGIKIATFLVYGFWHFGYKDFHIIAVRSFLSKEIFLFLVYLALATDEVKFFKFCFEESVCSKDTFVFIAFNFNK